MTDKSYVEREVQTLKGLYKEGEKSNDQHKFQDELQNLATKHPEELKSVLYQLKAAGDHKSKGHYDSNLPHIDIFMGEGKDAGKVKQIDVMEQNKYAERGGLHDHSYMVRGKEIVLNKEYTKELNQRNNDLFNPVHELQDMKLRFQPKVDEEAAKGDLVWKRASNGKLYPLNPESTSHVLSEDKSMPAEKPFSDSCQQWGRTDAMARYAAHMTGNENIVQKIVDAVEKLNQFGRLD